MAGISFREFARRDGCDPKLVRRAVQQGRLKPLENGLLDERLVASDWRKTNRRIAPTQDGDKGGDTVLTPEPPLTPDVESLSRWLEDILAGRFKALHEAEKVKENALALKHLLEGRKKAGELIDIQAAQNAVFEVFRAYRDGWLNWPSKIGPLLAAELRLEAERVVEALTPHVHQQLTDLGEPDPELGD